jgi:6-phospho-3-hexuloisomerase
MTRFHERILEEVRAALARVPASAAGRLVREIRRAKRIYISGVGRSGLVVKAFGQRLMHLGFEVHLADEITAPGIRRGDVLVACSGTGTTMLTRYMARKARRIGARVVAITAAPRSPLARAAHVLVRVPLPPGGSRQPARTAFEQALLLFLDGIVLQLMSEMRVRPQRIEHRHANLE